MKIYLCLIAAVLFQSGSAINPCVSDCTGSPDGRFPDCNDCQTYHVCSDNMMTSQSCDAGSQYDIISETCQPQAQAECGNNFFSLPSMCTIDCSDVGTGEFPYCGDCSKSIVCNSGTVVTQLQCPNNGVYNLMDRSCTSPNGAVCGHSPLLSPDSLNNMPASVRAQAVNAAVDIAEQNEIPVPTFSNSAIACTPDCKDVSKDGTFPYCASCAAFVLCYNNTVQQTINCPGGLKFDAVNMRCDTEDVVVCGVPSVVTTEPTQSGRFFPIAYIPIECMTNSCSDVPGIGQYPLCGVCDKSVLCLGGTAIIKTCNFGLLYDAIGQRCTFPRLATCGLARTTPKPTTTVPTTTTPMPTTTTPMPTTTTLMPTTTTPMPTTTTPMPTTTTTPMPTTTTTPMPTTTTTPMPTTTTPMPTTTTPMPTTTTPAPGITPRSTVNIPCSIDCRNISGVKYVPFCNDCSRGLFCTYGRIRATIRCPFGFLYDIVTRICQRPEFTTCGVGQATVEATTIPTTASPIPNCITNCNGRNNGYYQSCRGCRFYAACFNGIFYDARPCPYRGFPLFFDDNLKNCVFRSSTCTVVGK